MPIVKLALPNDLLTFQQKGLTINLNVERYPDFQAVVGTPTYAPGSPTDAMREAFVALKIAAKRAAAGLQQKVYLGDPAVELLYGRSTKHKDEQDCDVIGYVLRGAAYGYYLGEGKGTDILKAVKQLNVAVDLIEKRKKDPGPVLGGVVATHRLHYIEWDDTRKNWFAYVGEKEEPNITNRLRPNIAKASPSLQRDRVYLVGGPEENGLPVWNIVARSSQPFTVYAHDRSLAGNRGVFRPVGIGAGSLEIYYVG